MPEERLEKIKIKYGEWRPIGVCDKAEPGKMKANTFSKKDFLKISSVHVDRNDWQENQEVMKIVMQYAKKLAKRSTLTQGMKQVKVDEIKLVGSVMHISKTPILNRESRDGKVQFFQVGFKEGAAAQENKKKNLPWGGILITILSTILIVMIYTLITRPGKIKPLSPFKFNTSMQETEFCSARRDSDAYIFDLDEAQAILKSSLITNSFDSFDTGLVPCELLSGPVTTRERQFLRCYQFLKKQNYPSVTKKEKKKIDACLLRVQRAVP